LYLLIFLSFRGTFVSSIMLKNLRAALGGGGSSKDAGEPSAAAGSVKAAVSRRLDTAVQLSGVLYKKDTSGSESWVKRLFVIKDGFLLYYAPPAGGDVDGVGGGGTRGAFNMHPKGVVPLDGVEVRRGKRRRAARRARERKRRHAPTRFPVSFVSRRWRLCARGPNLCRRCRRRCG